MIVGGTGAAEETRAVSYHTPPIQSPASADHNIFDLINLSFQRSQIDKYAFRFV